MGFRPDPLRSSAQTISMTSISSSSSDAGERPMHIRRTIGAGMFVSLVVFATGTVGTQSPPHGQWRYYGGDKGYTRYSPVDQINKDNVARLQVVWRRPALDAQF